LSIDIGGSKLLVGIVNEDGNILVSRKSPFINPTQETVYAQIIAECSALLKIGHNFCAVGISIPGLADPVKGMWVYACFSKISGFPIAKMISDYFGKPVFIENDANICAYGEKMFGHTKNVASFIWMTISNGIGAGVFLNGSIYQGWNGNAGEIGHINVVDNGRVCPCGNKGCLEAYAAGPGIVRQYNELTGETGDITAKDIANLARNGHGYAKEVFRKTGFYIAKAIAATVNILNVQMVVLGGGITMSYDLFIDSLKDTLDGYMYNKANKELILKKTALNYEASLIGAAAYAYSCVRK